MDSNGLPAWMLSGMKWTGALIALLLLVSYATPRALDQLQQSITYNAGDTDDDNLPDAEEADTEPRETIEGQVQEASTDLATRFGTVQSTSAESIEIGPGGAEQIVIGFDAIPQDTACLIDVTLEVFLIDTTDTEVYVYPGVLLDITRLTDGQALPPNAVIEDSAPAVALAGEGTSGWLRWDVSAAYRLAARSASADAPVVLALTHPESEDETVSTIFGTTENPDDWTPRLIWSAVTGPDGQGCEGLGGGAPLPDTDTDTEGDILEQPIEEAAATEGV